MTHGIAIRHNFETAHRLPHLGGKCKNLHGHSWLATISVTAPGLTDQGTVVEFGGYKAAVRGWIDTHLDHGAILGHKDKLVAPLQAEGCKVLVFGDPPHPERGTELLLPIDGRVDVPAEDLVRDLEWPTVENVAVLLQRVAERALTVLPGARAVGAAVAGVHVTETAVNAAVWER